MAPTSNKTIAKNTIFLYMRMLLVMVVSLYTSRVILRELGVTDFGIYNVVGSIVASLSFLTASLDSGTSRFFAFYIGKNDNESLNKYYKLSLTSYLFLSGIILVLAETLGLWFVNAKLVIDPDRMGAANWVYQFSIISTIFGMLASPSRSMIISYERMSIYAYVGIAEAIFRLVIAYLITISNGDKLIIYALLLLTMQFLNFLFYTFYANNHFKNVCRYRFYFEWNPFKEFVSYSGWILFGTMSEVARGQGFNILLNLFFGTVVNAARGIAYQVRGAIQQFVANFSMAARPQITKHYAAGEYDSMRLLVFRASRLCYYLILVISVPLMIQMPYVLRLWLGQYPEHTVLFTNLVLLIAIIESLASPLDTAIVASGNVKYFQLFTGGFLILNLPVAYIALKLGGSPESPMILAAIMAVLSHGIRMYFGKTNAGIGYVEYIKQVLIQCIALTIIIVMPLVPLYEIFDFASIGGFFIFTAFSVLWSLTVVYFIGTSKQEKIVIKGFIKNKIHK